MDARCQFTSFISSISRDVMDLRFAPHTLFLFIMPTHYLHSIIFLVIDNLFLIKYTPFRMKKHKQTKSHMPYHDLTIMSFHNVSRTTPFLARALTATGLLQSYYSLLALATAGLSVMPSMPPPAGHAVHEVATSTIAHRQILMSRR